jgi:uncharacterized membrane protein
VGAIALFIGIAVVVYGGFFLPATSQTIQPLSVMLVGIAIQLVGLGDIGNHVVAELRALNAQDADD